MNDDYFWIKCVFNKNVHIKIILILNPTRKENHFEIEIIRFSYGFDVEI